jgi:hypothetical protein
MKPSLGRIVHFEIDEQTANEINGQSFSDDRANNRVQPGELVPAMIVRVWSEICVNLKLLLDGPGDLWITSVCQGTGPRTFREPARV